MKEFFKKHKKQLKIAVIIYLCFVVLCTGVLWGSSEYIKAETTDRIISEQQAAELENIDCILVPGCFVRADGTPGSFLEDRLTKALQLYTLEVSPKLLMSGDHEYDDYNEVGVMKSWTVDKGVVSEDIFLDHAGLSTYESLYRAKEIFGAEKIVIVSQEMYLYRSLYIAQQLGLEAWGVATEYHEYSGKFARDAREVLARVKDIIYTMLKPEAEYMGETIDLSGDGNITNG